MNPNAVHHADVLRAIQAAPAPLLAQADVAHAAGRPTKNIGRDLGLLERDGLVIRDGEAGFELTDEAARALRALEVADGTRAIPEGAMLVAHDRLRPNPLNPRKRFDPEEIAGLADSIEAEAQQNPGGSGLLQPLVVFPEDAAGARTIFAGEKRWRAFELLISAGRRPAGVLLECMERAVEPGQEAAQSAFVAIVENGQRGGLTELEEARAYLALMEATGWSARECARRTRRASAEGSESAARLIQERVRVVREASPENIKAHEDGELTWERLRDSVKVAKDKPALELTPKLALALVELAHKGDVDPADPSDTLEPGYTRLAVMQLAGGPLSTLQERGLISTRGFDWTAGGGLLGYQRFYGRVLAKTTTAGQWLADNGFHQDRAALLFRARAAVLGDLQAHALAETGGYATPELNVVEPPQPAPVEREAAPAAEIFPTSPPAAPAPAHSPASAPAAAPTPAGEPEEAPLTGKERLAMVELAHKLEVEPVELEGGEQRGVTVSSYWTNPTAVGLAQDRRMIGWVHRRDGPPLAVLQDKGRQWLVEQNLVLESGKIHVTEPDVDHARGQAGQAGWPGAGYVTPWLNVAEAAPAERPGATVEAAIAAQPGQMEAARQHLERLQAIQQRAESMATVWAAGGPSSFEEFASILADGGCPLPWTDGPDGAVLAANGAEVVTVDVDRLMPEPIARAVAVAVILAVNTLGGGCEGRDAPAAEA